MALTQEQAVAKLDQLRKSTHSMRAYYDSFWTLAKIYDGGPQWGYLTSGAEGMGVHYLKSVTKAHRTDIRVTVDMIHDKVMRLRSALMPAQIGFDLKEASTNDLVMKYACSVALQEHLRRAKALAVLRDKESHRLVKGAAIIRRTLTTAGRPIVVSNRGKNDELAIRRIRPGWAIVSPHEILRDPAANTMKFAEDEEIFAHEKPRTVGWVKRNFGIDLPNVKTTMGSLMQYQQELGAASGYGSAAHVMESKQKAVIVYECFFKDADEVQPWPWVLYAYMDTSEPERNDMRVLRFGRNPFWGLPFHMYCYDSTITEAPWPRGVPHLLKGLQDCANIGWSWVLRTMVHGGPRWRYEKGTLDPAFASTALTNDTRVPIVWQRDGMNQNVGPPERVVAPPVPPVAEAILGHTPGWMRSALNLSDVQFGESSKRGESGEALETKLGEANQPLEATRRDDELVTEELLLGTLFDLTDRRHLLLKDARELVGKHLSDEHIRELVREETPKSIVAVKVHSMMHRPKTPGDVRGDFIDLVEKQIKQPEDAEWEMMLQGGVVTNTDMKGAYDLQMLEIEMLRGGQDVPVEMTDKDGYHLRTIEHYKNQPASLQLDDEARQMIQDHWNAHKSAEMAKALGQQLMSGQGAPPQLQQGTPPAQAMPQLPGPPAGAAEPAMALSP